MKGKASSWESPLCSQDQPCAILHRDSSLESHPYFTNTTQLMHVEMSDRVLLWSICHSFFLWFTFSNI